MKSKESTLVLSEDLTSYYYSLAIKNNLTKRQCIESDLRLLVKLRNDGKYADICKNTIGSKLSLTQSRTPQTDFSTIID